MSKIKSSLSLLMVLAFIVAMFYLPATFTKQDVTYAETTEIQEMLDISDNSFNVVFTAYDRENHALDSTGTKTAIVNSNQLDEHEVEYVCYNWSDLQYFNIEMSSKTLPIGRIYHEVQLRVSYIETEDLTQNVEGEEVIFESVIENNTLSRTPLMYFIDEGSTPESSQRKYGHGFGLYKFEFTYTYSENNDDPNEAAKIIPQSSGIVYFAIEPDDIDEIASEGNNNFALNYTISSSNEFLNIYNLRIDTEKFNYVNPCHIIWTVEGTDISNVRYVLTYSDTLLDGYNSYQYLWYSLEERNGTTFTFDSNNIEGDFTVTCTIYDTENNYVASASQRVSTVKENNFTYLWLIIILAIVLIIIIASIVLIIILKKNEKLW